MSTTAPKYASTSRWYAWGFTVTWVDDCRMTAPKMTVVMNSPEPSADDTASLKGLMDSAHHAIMRILNPGCFNLKACYDVASLALSISPVITTHCEPSLLKLSGVL